MTCAYHGLHVLWDFRKLKYSYYLCFLFVFSLLIYMFGLMLMQDTHCMSPNVISNLPVDILLPPPFFCTLYMYIDCMELYLTLLKFEVQTRPSSITIVMEASKNIFEQFRSPCCLSIFVFFCTLLCLHYAESNLNFEMIQ